jgi:glycosyltransferase involved in cell wall biosynthesis
MSVTEKCAIAASMAFDKPTISDDMLTGACGTFIHVIDSISDESSGPSYSVPRLCEALAAQGATVRLLTVGDLASTFVGFRHEAYPADFSHFPGLRRLRFSSALKNALSRVVETATIIHTHGLWRMSNIYPAHAALRTRNHLVLSPRGMLGDAALEFSAPKKQLFWSLAQGGAARAATCLHATSRQEYEDIRAFGLKAPIAIIPNGIDVPPTMAKGAPSDGHRTVLYLGRLHPKKGIDRLLEAWKRVKAQHPQWQLDIVGPIDSDYARSLKASATADLESRVRFLGPLYGVDKSNAYRRAGLFVLPTLNENFAMTVAEALAQGTPVISTRGAPWAGLARYGCGWWIEHGTEPLAAAMDQAMDMSRGQLALMGEAGRAWMCRDFDWNAVAASMRSVYHWLSGRGECPSCVVMD